MAEESKQSGLTNDGSEDDRSIGSLSLEDNYSDLEESLDFDIYIDDIPLIAEANSDIPQILNESSSKNVAHFTDPDSESRGPIPLNLSSFKEEDTSDYSELEPKRFSEDDLDDILLKDENSSSFEDDGPIALSSDELNNITDSEDYEDSDFGGKSQFSSNDSFDSDELNDTYDTELGEDEDITLGSDELDHILNPDEEDDEEVENDFGTKSFFDSEPEEEDGPIALSSDELNNITDSDYSDSSEFETDEFIADPPPNLFDESSSDEEIALSGDELNNLLESGNVEEDDEFEDGEAKSFFDSEPEEEDESIALSPDELNNITDSDYQEDDGIQTEDLSSGIESNEYGVSTDNIFDESNNEDDEDIALSGDELNNILETGEIEVEGDTYEADSDEDNAKSFFDSEEDESIALSPDELGNITAEQDFGSEEGIEDNFDLSEATEDLEMESSPSLFEDTSVEDEEIALSGDELNNLLESGEIEMEEADSMGSSLFESSTDEDDESIALSPDELGNITAEQDFEMDSVDSSEDSVAQEDNFDLTESATDDFNFDTPSNLFGESPEVEDEEIALSGDELNNLLESGEIETEEADSMGSSLFESSTEEEDESIALSPDELGNITAEQDFEMDSIDSAEDSVAQEDNFDLTESTTDDFNFDAPSNLFGESAEVEDEEIALSGDELDNILQSGEIETEEAADYTNPIDSGMVIGDDDDFVIDDNSSLSNLGDFNMEESSPEDLSESTEKLDSFRFGSVKKEELKKVISYMDELLGSLPDSYIKEFASSEYFELYKKIMNELEL